MGNAVFATDFNCSEFACSLGGPHALQSLGEPSSCLSAGVRSRDISLPRLLIGTLIQRFCGKIDRATDTSQATRFSITRRTVQLSFRWCPLARHQSSSTVDWNFNSKILCEN